ncbi:MULTISPECIES: hypothetical protein [unclassified Synechococcus]|uniref:hypothetical protein n=1 Tax=unclassified Synechococcus TaxID=2626047 RepID=UPI0039B0F756
MSIFSDKFIPSHEAIHGCGVYKGNEVLFRDYYINHFHKVVDKFIDKPGRLLTLNIEIDNWYLTKTLQGFLGISSQDANSLPVSNKSKKIH